jgi:hypothetical protein
MPGYVSGGGSVTGGAGSGAGGRSLGSGAGGGVGRERGSPNPSERQLTPRPGARRLDGLPGSVVFRILLLEMRKDVLGAVGGPERQCPVVGVVETHRAFGEGTGGRCG